MRWKKARKESTRKAQKVTDEEDDGSMVRNNLEITEKLVYIPNLVGAPAPPLCCGETLVLCPSDLS